MDLKLRFPIALLLAISVVGASLAVLFSNLVTFRTPAIAKLPPSDAGTVHGAVVFNPPRVEDAPAEIRDAVLYGARIMTETGTQLPEYVGNTLACTNCHFEGGRSRSGISLVGVAATYPKYRSRTKYATDLVSRTNECFERSMNGTRLDPESREMQALMAYYQWISRGLPVYAEIPWLGLKRVPASRAPDHRSGAVVYVQKCAVCHGQDGGGTTLAPALWGPRSFNDGAGMSQPHNFASFGLAYMPKTAPALSPEEAVDVAAYVAKQPRPHFLPKRS